MRKLFFTIFSLCLLCFSSGVLLAGECNECHVKEGVEVTVPSIPPITLLDNHQSRSLSLADAFDYHGHACAGVTTTYRAIQYGIALLYGSAAPDRKDILVFSRSGTLGTIDFIDFLFAGADESGRTRAPEGMMPSRENFVFTVIRKSTCEAVDVKLKPERFPADYFVLVKKQKDGTASEEQGDVLHEYRKNIIKEFPTMAAEDLFGRPSKYKVLGWGEFKHHSREIHENATQEKHNH